MPSKKGFSARFELETQYNQSAYEALTEVSWKMFRQHFVMTKTYPFIAALCVLIAISLIAFRHKYGMPVLAAHVVALLFFMISMPLSNVTGKRRLCKKAIREASSQGPFPFSVRFLFNEDVIRVKLPGEKIADTPYARLTDIVSYGKWLFLFIGDHAYILHYDSFENEEEYSCFERFLSDKTGQTIWVMDVPKSCRQLAWVAR